ncbi:MBL fold metallo-hydrolase [Siminovitchia sp. FSL H7-0308]|uniref:MBL fold metallo-hydrolase n=1 Tax=Siminovitchia sp. FSL H7-0308 TaxID=2921432 RepID=UPI0030EB52E4
MRDTFTLPDIHPDTPPCELQVFNAGFCRAKHHHLVKNKPKTTMKIPALFFLIQHPVAGNLLFDTGYSTRFYAYTATFPFSLMSAITPVHITDQENAATQLKAIGIAPEEIRHVLLSHLHVDHSGGVQDFKHARFFVDCKEWEFGQRAAWRLLLNGYIKKLYDQIPLSKRTLLHFEKNGTPYGPFKHTIDLFQDGSIILISLPGHSIGQYGLLLNQPSGKRFFLLADAVYLNENYRTLTTGSWWSRLAHFNYKQMISWFSLFKQLEQNHPDLICIPSHDPAAYERFVVSSSSIR